MSCRKNIFWPSILLSVLVIGIYKSQATEPKPNPVSYKEPHLLAYKNWLILSVKHSKRNISTTSAPNVQCNADEFQCREYKCINRSFLCNSYSDCLSGEDEDIKYCNQDKSIKISKVRRCQSDWDCGSMYKYCTPQGYCSDRTPFKNCTSSQFRCNDGKCIEGNLRCNGDSDCTTGEDEIGCSSSMTTTSFPSSQCASDEFRCNDGKCIQAIQICDGDTDCSSQEDELDCPRLSSTSTISPSGALSPLFIPPPPLVSPILPVPPIIPLPPIIPIPIPPPLVSNSQTETEQNEEDEDNDDSDDDEDTEETTTTDPSTTTDSSTTTDPSTTTTESPCELPSRSCTLSKTKRATGDGQFRTECINEVEDGNPIFKIRYIQYGQIKLIEEVYATIEARNLNNVRTSFGQGGWADVQMAHMDAHGYGSLVKYVRPKDDKGHIVASRLGGPIAWYNLIPQSPLLNRDFDLEDSDWYKQEGNVVKWLKRNECVYVEYGLRIHYNLQKSRRPIGFTLQLQYYNATRHMVHQFQGTYSNQIQCTVVPLEDDIDPI